MPTPYEEHIITAFKTVCKANESEGGGASPSEVTGFMHEKGQLAEMDTVLDIEKIMRKLRNQGDL